MEEIKQPIKVYIKINKNKFITEINSEIFINNLEDWIFLDEGYGDKYAHAQSQYLKKPIINEDGSYNFKYTNKIEEI